MRHVVVDVKSRLTRLYGETREDKGLRGCWRNKGYLPNLLMAAEYFLAQSYYQEDMSKAIYVHYYNTG